MKWLRRMGRRLAVGYWLRCAREDARARDIVTPAGVWACAHCAHVSLTERAFAAHVAVCI
jgi:hypothetical protein